MSVINNKEKLRKAVNEIVGEKKINWNDENKKSFVLVMSNYCVNPNPEKTSFIAHRNQLYSQMVKESKSLIGFLKSENVSYVTKRIKGPLKFGLFEYIVSELGQKAFRLSFKKSEYFIKKYGDYTKDVKYQDLKTICSLYEDYVENPWILASLISISTDNLRKIITGTTTVYDADSKIRILIPREIRMKKLGYNPNETRNYEIPSFAKGFGTIAIPKSSRRSRI